jgi:hypothetical protein
MKLNLFVNYFQCGDKERQKELDFCFNTNKDSGLFSEIINFSDRPTYNDFFEATKAYPEDINILSNSDIYFNETINLVREMGTKDAYALTRSELEEGEIVSFEDKHHYNAEAKAKHSQDVWVFNGVPRGINGYFHIGRPGCDNRIAWEINAAKYVLSNPSDRIQCIHKHEESKRKYTMPDSVPPPYLWVGVIGIEQPRASRGVRRKI